EGVRLAYHHHMGTVVQSEEDVDTLMDAAGEDVGLLLDTGHAAFAGADPVSLARRYASKIGHLHAKDVRAPVCEQAKAEDWSFLRAVLAGVFTVPGDGSVAFERVFRELRDYSGWLILEAEQDPRIADPMTYASLGFRTIGARGSPFEGKPFAVYAPARSQVILEAQTRCELAVGSAPAEGRLPPRLIRPDDVGEEVRGAGTNTRYVRNVLPASAAAE